MAPFAIMGFLWWSSSREPAPTPQSDVRAFLHNGAHIVAYGALCASVVLALRRHGAIGSIGRPVAAGGIAVALAYGIVDELHQAYVPGRVCSVSDLLSDGMGAVLAVAILGWAYVAGRSWRGIALALLGSVASVSFATWGPW